jgi:hypothetical protein
VLLPNPIQLLEKASQSAEDFEWVANEIWHHQTQKVSFLQVFTKQTGQKGRVYFPVQFFRDFSYLDSYEYVPADVFESSGTTGSLPSRHPIYRPEIYRYSFEKAFTSRFGTGPFTIAGLLPGYLERSNSSLVYMVKSLIENFGNPGSGFYLNNFQALEEMLFQASERGENILLFGVTFALLDFSTFLKDPLPFSITIIETGGMKGKREELTRQELYELLILKFPKANFCSEYGMTELLSQAYTIEPGKFICPPWMKVEIYDLHDPFRILEKGKYGRIHITDLANMDTCAFIRTDDIGKEDEKGAFEVLGRVDAGDLRGCSLLYS